MMKHLLLTGATGLVGQYLLRDFLMEGLPLAVLIRSKGKRSAQERLEQILGHWEDELGRRLPRPVCLEGDIASPGLGLSHTERRWAGQHVGQLLHNAASLNFTGKDHAKEPWLSNKTGTAHVLEFCREQRLRELHYMSTAYVCGRRVGIIRETELDGGQEFRNDYEQSKLEAEKLVRSANFLDRLTVYRPAIIVGDSRTGFTTTYHAFYSYVYFVWLYVRDAVRDAAGRVHAPVRLNLTGNEQRNLVPVDWISSAVSHLVLHPRYHGSTYHLTPTHPVTARELEGAMSDYFNYHGPTFVGHEALGRMNDLEHQFYTFVNQYQPYWAQEPRFDCSHTLTALPDLPCPRVDSACLLRMIDFAVQDDWGKRRKRNLLTRPTRAAIPV
jgi:thioester reductase-like protein